MGLPGGGPLREHCGKASCQRGGQRGSGAIRGLLDCQGPDVGGVEGSAELVEAAGVLDGAGNRGDRLGLRSTQQLIRNSRVITRRPAAVGYRAPREGRG